MHKIKILLLLICTFLFETVFGQDTSNTVEMADLMHANGKIYVVVTVLCIVFAGIVTFLIMIDRKVSRLEKKINEMK